MARNHVDFTELKSVACRKSIKPFFVVIYSRLFIVFSPSEVDIDRTPLGMRATVSPSEVGKGIFHNALLLSRIPVKMILFLCVIAHCFFVNTAVQSWSHNCSMESNDCDNCGIVWALDA